MTLPDKFTGAPLPQPAESSNASAYLKAIFDVVGPKTVLIATSQSDRDAKYSDAPTGAIATCGTLNAEAVWLKIPGGWRTIYYDTGWVTTGFTYPDPTNWSTRYAKIRDRNGLVEFRLSAERLTTGTILATGNVNPDATVCRIPASFLPTFTDSDERLWPSATLGGFTASVAIYSTGNVDVAAVDQGFGTTFLIGQSLRTNGTWMKG